MSSVDSASHVEPPFSPPDCPWVSISAGSPIPENAVYQNGTLDGSKVYIGRVYDGKSLYVGTAIPQKGICIYLNKNLEVKSSPNYEILTTDSGDPLWFLEMELDHDNVFLSGIDDTGEILYYTGRYVDEKFNTYYGWVSKATRSIYIPSPSAQVLDKNFGVLIHRFLHMLCICPTPPPEAIFH